MNNNMLRNPNNITNSLGGNFNNGQYVNLSNSQSSNIKNGQNSNRSNSQKSNIDFSQDIPNTNGNENLLNLNNIGNSSFTRNYPILEQNVPGRSSTIYPSTTLISSDSLLPTYTKSSLHSQSALEALIALQTKIKSIESEKSTFLIECNQLEESLRNTNFKLSSIRNQQTESLNNIDENQKKLESQINEIEISTNQITSQLSNEKQKILDFLDSASIEKIELKSAYDSLEAEKKALQDQLEKDQESLEREQQRYKELEDQVRNDMNFKRDPLQDLLTIPKLQSDRKSKKKESKRQPNLKIIKTRQSNQPIFKSPQFSTVSRTCNNTDKINMNKTKSRYDCSNRCIHEYEDLPTQPNPNEFKFLTPRLKTRDIDHYDFYDKKKEVLSSYCPNYKKMVFKPKNKELISYDMKIVLESLYGEYNSLYNEYRDLERNKGQYSIDELKQMKDLMEKSLEEKAQQIFKIESSKSSRNKYMNNQEYKLMHKNQMAYEFLRSLQILNK